MALRTGPIINQDPATKGDSDANEDADIKKEELVEQSGVVEWLQEAGIPASSGIAQTLATPQLLTADYGWDFRPFQGRPKTGTKDIITAHRDLMALLNEDAGRGLSILIPKAWWVEDLREKNAKERTDEEQPALTKEMMARALQPIILEYNELTDPEDFTLGSPLFIKEAETSAESFEVLKVEDVFSQSQLNDDAFTAIQTVLAALTLDKTTNLGSELPVERHLGRLLLGIFEADNCHTLSNTTLDYPTILGCWASSSKPNFACRWSLNGKDEPRQSLYDPVILVGEAKTIVDEGRLSARMACAVQPTLQLFAAHLTHKYKKDGMWSSDHLKTGQGVRRYGISYDRCGLQFYVFFPAYKVKGKTVQWTFVCQRLAGRKTPGLETMLVYRELMGRASLLQFLLLLKREAMNTAKEMGSLELPQELLDLERDWKRTFPRKAT
ncbi:hypothetical protein EVG20_g389 [Dentipellis fragilis]|uniref:Uncharacterized protein n=1 Tax=Dentipellis fragilis TaxID=205917 RepID=A0A4Y9ZF60_9AGAM|nr:hypothetical protein EVG20_g389 [Dentipellis fragilis]